VKSFEQLLEDVLAQGFDRSRLSYDDDDTPDGVVVRCSQCEALVINGLACHEQRCPNDAPEDHNYESEDWTGEDE